MRRSAFLGAVLAATLGGLGGAVAAAPTQSIKATIQRQLLPVTARSEERWGGRPKPGCRRGREGWSVAEGKRRAAKRRNRARHKAQVQRRAR